VRQRIAHAAPLLGQPAADVGGSKP
jgi:hypothetical protein